MTYLTNILRPNSLDEIIGQEHLTGPTGPLKLMLEKNNYKSCILWGPPGAGKTSIVKALAKSSSSTFYQINATEATVKDLRKIISQAKSVLPSFTFVFIDEIHRFSKSQQDVLLPAVEDGLLVMFGATTERPKFAVNSTILSRCLVFEVKPLSAQACARIILKVRDFYKANHKNIKITSEASKALINRCSGDARKLILSLETAVDVLSSDGHVTIDHINVAIPDKHLIFDSSGNDHFDLAHCYQEAIQNSDVDSAIYWLAKWLKSGEDPAYISRRMLITAFEDCAGNPNAWMAAMAASYTTERTGLPECMIPLSLATCEMAMSSRNKSAYYAIKEAMDDVDNNATIHVPPELRAGTHGYIKAISKIYLKQWNKD